MHPHEVHHRLTHSCHLGLVCHVVVRCHEVHVQWLLFEHHWVWEPLVEELRFSHSFLHGIHSKVYIRLWFHFLSFCGLLGLSFVRVLSNHIILIIVISLFPLSLLLCWFRFLVEIVFEIILGGISKYVSLARSQPS